MRNRIIQRLFDEVIEGCRADTLVIGQDAKPETGGGTMTEMKRTAGLIRSYLKAFEYGLAIAKTPRKRRAYYTNLGINARTDLPRVLDAAVRLRKAVFDAWEWGWMGNARELLAGTIWLIEPELSPEPALTPDGENEEESET